MNILELFRYKLNELFFSDSANCRDHGQYVKKKITAPDKSWDTVVFFRGVSMKSKSIPRISNGLKQQGIMLTWTSPQNNAAEQAK